MNTDYSELFENLHDIAVEDLIQLAVDEDVLKMAEHADIVILVQELASRLQAVLDITPDDETIHEYNN